MKAQFSSCGKRSTKNQSEQLQQVAVGAMGLVCDEFGAHMLAAVAARVPSSKSQLIITITPPRCGAPNRYITRKRHPNDNPNVQDVHELAGGCL